MEGYASPVNVVEAVNVPYELLEWVMTDEAKELLGKVKEKSRASDIQILSPRPGKASLEVTATSSDQLRAAASLLEMHLNFQVEYQQRKTLTEKMEKDLRATNEEFKNGQRVEFSVPDNLIGLIIGKKGSNLEKVKEETGVDRVIVDPKMRVVRIRDNDPEKVRLARDLLEFQEIAVPLAPTQIRSVIGEKGKNINEIWRKSGCVNVSIEKESYLRLVGTRRAVSLAKDLVETQLEFETKMKSLRDDEMSIKRELSKIDAAYKEYSPSPQIPYQRRGSKHSFNQSQQQSTNPQMQQSRQSHAQQEETASTGSSTAVSAVSTESPKASSRSQPLRQTEQPSDEEPGPNKRGRRGRSRSRNNQIFNQTRQKQHKDRSGSNAKRDAPLNKKQGTQQSKKKGGNATSKLQEEAAVKQEIPSADTMQQQQQQNIKNINKRRNGSARRKNATNVKKEANTSTKSAASTMGEPSSSVKKTGPITETPAVKSEEIGESSATAKAKAKKPSRKKQLAKKVNGGNAENQQQSQQQQNKNASIPRSGGAKRQNKKSTFLSKSSNKIIEEKQQ